MEECKSAFKILTRKPTGKRTLRKPRCKCEDSIRKDLKKKRSIQEIGADSAQDRDYWNLRVP